MNKNRERNMILEHNLWSVMWKMSWPAVIAMVLFGLNVVFDAIFVGRLMGEEALAGVSVVYPLTQIPLGLGSLIGVGAGSLLSILIGQEDRQTQRELVGVCNFLVIILGVAMTILGFIFMEPLLKVMGAQGTSLIYAQSYYKITLIGSVLWIGGIGYNMIVRAEGRMGTAALMMGIGLVVNVVANYILMVVMSMGVEGAAWGTNLGMLVYIILFFIYCARGKASFETNEKKITINKELFKQIIGLGFPSFLMTVMFVIQGIVVMRALNNYGSTEDLAFYGMVFRLYNLMLTPIYGLMRAMQPVVGINFGAKKYNRVISAYKIFALSAFIIMFPFCLLAIIFPQGTLGLMLPGKIFPASDIFNFRIYLAVAPLLPIVLTAMTFWPAIKKPKPAGILGIARQVLLYIPAMIILPKYFGVSWVYKGAFLIDTALAVLITLMIKNEFSILRKKEV